MSTTPPIWLSNDKEFGKAPVDRMGVLKAGKTFAHIVKQTPRTLKSGTADQTYWTGIN